MKRLGTGVYLGRYEPGTPDWTASRARRIGGSEVAAVCGWSPWESPFSLWHRKAGTIPDEMDQERLWWGREIEPVVAKRFALAHPEFDVRRCPSYVHETRDYQTISPDRLLFTRARTREWELLEIKHAFDQEEWGDWESDDIPLHYRCQVMWAMDVFGVTSHRLAVYFGGGRYREFIVDYNPDEAAILRKRVEEFLASLDEGTPPPIDGHAATTATIRALHPDVEDVDLDVPAEIAEPYLAAVAAERDAKTEKARVGNELAMFMGTARRAIFGENKKGKPRSIASRVAIKGGNPYLRVNPHAVPTPLKEIA